MHYRGVMNRPRGYRLIGIVAAGCLALGACSSTAQDDSSSTTPDQDTSANGPVVITSVEQLSDALRCEKFTASKSDPTHDGTCTLADEKFRLLVFDTEADLQTAGEAAHDLARASNVTGTILVGPNWGMYGIHDLDPPQSVIKAAENAGGEPVQIGQRRQHRP